MAEKLDFDPAAMDAAAAEFDKEFSKLPAETQKTIANLVKKHYMAAGYKRIGRVVIAHADKK